VSADDTPPLSAPRARGRTGTPASVVQFWHRSALDRTFRPAAKPFLYPAMYEFLFCRPRPSARAAGQHFREPLPRPPPRSNNLLPAAGSRRSCAAGARACCMQHRRTGASKAPGAARLTQHRPHEKLPHRGAPLRRSRSGPAIARRASTTVGVLTKNKKDTEHEPTDIDIYIGCAKQKSVRRWREVPAGVGRVEVRSGKCACALSLLVGVHVRMHRRVSRRQHVCRCARLRVLCGKVRKGREEREGSRRSVRASEASLPAATAAGLRLARARERVQRSNARGGHASGPRARRPVNKKAAGLVHCRTRAVRVCPDSGVRDPSVPPAHALPRCPCSCPSAAHPLHQCEPCTRNQHTT